MSQIETPAKRITVVLGRFEPLVSRGLVQILIEDDAIAIVDNELDHDSLERVVARRALRVAMINEAPASELAFLDRLRVIAPTIGVVMLAHRPTAGYSMRMLAKGVSCLSKALPAADILAAVHLAAAGHHAFTPIQGRISDPNCSTPSATLTRREAEVFEYLSRGLSYGETARALQIGVETVRTHSANIRRKLGVASKRELIGLALPTGFGLVEPSG